VVLLARLERATY